MNAKKILSVLILLFCLSLLKGQEIIRSESASIILNAKKQKDISKPSIMIVSPAVQEGNRYKTLIDRVEIIGKIDNLKGPGSLFINSQKTEIDEMGAFKATVFLKPGINEIPVIAFYDKDSKIEEKLEMEYEPPEVTLANKVRDESVYYGLIIGINEYRDKKLGLLGNPVGDSEKLIKVLTSYYIFDPKNIIFLKNAGKDEIMEALDELRKKVTPKDNLLIFYAGHGYWDENSNVGYWLPSDAREDSRNTWLPNSSIVDYLKEIKARHILLIADACFSGSIFKSRAVIVDRKETIQHLYELRSRKAMTSGTLTVVPDRSAFTKYLVEKLAENKNLLFTSEELFSSFQEIVENNSETKPRFGEIQNVDDKGGDFIFIKKQAEQ